MSMCVPDPDRCGRSRDRHWCDEPRGHVSSGLREHRCECGYGWSPDLLGELSEVAYLAYFTTPYLDAPDIPTGAVAKAGSAAGTPMRRAVAAVLTQLGIQAA